MGMVQYSRGTDGEGEPQPRGRESPGDGGDQGEGLGNEMVTILVLQGLLDFIV